MAFLTGFEFGQNWILREIYCCCTLFSKKRKFSGHSSGAPEPLTVSYKFDMTLEKHLYTYLGNMHSMTPRSYRESKSIWPLVCTEYIDRSIIDLIFPNHFFFLDNLQETLNWLLIDRYIQYKPGVRFSVRLRGHEVHISQTRIHIPIWFSLGKGISQTLEYSSHVYCQSN